MYYVGLGFSLRQKGEAASGRVAANYKSNRAHLRKRQHMKRNQLYLGERYQTPIARVATVNLKRCEADVVPTQVHL